MSNYFYHQFFSGLYFFSKVSKFISSKWRMIPLLDRWLFRELLPPFFFAISAFTVVSLSVGVMFDLVRKIVESGLALKFALQVFFLKLPSFLVISFPMAILMATLLTFSRLSSNSEVKALKSIGISTKRMIVAAITLGLLMTGITFIFNDLIVPSANKSAEATLRRGLGVSMHSDYVTDIMYSRFGKIVDPSSNISRDGMTHLFYAKEFQNKTMIDVTLLDFSRLGYKQMLVAKKGYWNNLEANWEFHDGNILTIAPNGGSTSISFENYVYPLDSGPKKIAKIPKDANYMTLSDAYKAKDLYKLSGNLKEVRRMEVRIQEKFTLPMACVVFSLIGSSLACSPNTRSTQGQGFALSIVLILAYYILSFVFSSLGVSGALSPFVGAWSPVIISLSGGLYLLNKADD
ncbi:Unclassified ABC-type transport system permease [Prochlorococcus marinus subsp. marinus str. CCMP1375]|uniref:Unclassified ABC-type transport system permease n=2 Tax=Prochlorococcaceae TaxID=2881426 RepID=Q7VCA4_PROMA|nr:Unclassified ABC-type transport system permease [Prochlorococcus marinus subsp. marinus str. CCMP1375]